jgi:uncharacterized protein YbbK (DUF523 family)
MKDIPRKSKEENKPEILISSCLIGCPVRYNGSSNKIDGLGELVKQGKAIAMCPEIIGGLSVPREPVEIEKGKTAKEVLEGGAKVLDKEGKDYTQEFINGANELLKVCKEKDIKTVIIKEGSPSCGSNKIYDGTFLGGKISGRGITAELLSQNRITIFCEHNFPKELL